MFMWPSMSAGHQPQWSPHQPCPPVVESVWTLATLSPSTSPGHRPWWWPTPVCPRGPGCHTPLDYRARWAWPDPCPRGSCPHPLLRPVWCRTTDRPSVTGSRECWDKRPLVCTTCVSTSWPTPSAWCIACVVR